MPGTGGLTALIGSIYDVALDSTKWPETLGKIADFTGGQACLLVLNDPAAGPGTVYHQHGVDAEFMRCYRERYGALEPLALAPGSDPTQIASLSDLTPIAAVRLSGFRRDWLAPQGFLDAASAVLCKAERGSAYFCVLRAQAHGPVDDEMLRRLQLVVPHLRRAVTVENAIASSRSRNATLVDILDCLSAAILLVDAEGCVLHANTAGGALLRDGDFLRIACGRLAASDAQANEKLREALTAGGGASQGKCAALAFTVPNGAQYVVQLLPLSKDPRRVSTSVPATALFVRKAKMNAPAPAEVIGKAYKLTPTELRVLLAIVDIGRVADVAQNLGVADTTIKTHLSRLFEKTGAARQADLVRLVAAFSSPLLD